MTLTGKLAMALGLTGLALSAYGHAPTIMAGNAVVFCLGFACFVAGD